ncbi:sushi, von Willebrand factor type A, EGF and pentraxin domain-containing protein 1-like [Neolamprologus brichardi]|uniref:sushi, von Willebrand factor type A, EGF and pentraxin domain-containing protein 1-like n=1 Tax=Neolamprologus brichardi TaxID=32507 RepID=UPI0003EBFF0E|nr:sushi, von Willebrand factor type A, EGF and pentraxin domain-containing protein 1-like [Neolamprologus brichardi]
MFYQRYSLTLSWSTCLLLLCVLDVWTTAWPAVQQSQRQQQQPRRYRQMSTLSSSSSSSAGNLSESAESKVERLGMEFKRNVRELREKSSCLDLVFLVDESSSVGANNFLSELRFIRKMLSDFPVAPENTRVALVTFSSKTHVVTRVDHISAPKSHQHKCSLFNQEIPAINYRGGGTYTKGAFQRAAQILRHSRSNATKVIFLITDGYSNGGDPRPVAAALRERGVEIFTLGIWQGNIRELHDMASQPKDQHCYLVHNFAEFEALARRALHEDLPTGSYIQEDLSRCASLCEAGKDCCDLMASCKCGTHTGQYDCICEKGYYGKGLQHECTACPPGTYKPEGTPGGVSTCLPCPDAQHTSQPGSTSPDDCVCKPGYKPMGMTCQVIHCPALLPPEYGFFVQNVCNNHFDAACGVRCEPGFDLQGDGIRLCQADGTWSGTPASCRVRSCPHLSLPKHGFLSCSNSFGSYRVVCQVGCDRGYRLEGDSELTCQANYQWSGPQPRCVEVRCPPIVTLKNIFLSPPACGRRAVSPGFVCLLNCRPGYSLQGNRKAVCLSSGNWTANVYKAVCTDTEPPWLQCPDNIVAGTVERRGTAIVSWNVPNATDNSKEEVVVQAKPVYSLPQLFPIGKETITYFATDLSGNQANCSFTVTVIDTEPPVIDRCRSPPAIQATNAETAVDWEVPQFSDNSDCPKLENTAPHLHVSTVDVRPGAQVQLSCDPGFYLVGEPVLQCQNKGEWSHNLPSCERVSCGPPHPLENGFFQGTDFHAGSSVVYECNAGFYLLGDTKVHCTNSGKWGGTPPACLDVDECALGSDCDVHASCQNTEGSYTCTCIHPYTGDGKNCTEPVKCENPGTPDFGRRYGSNFLMGSEVVFSCDNGYELIGSSQLQCLETGDWDDAVPYCRALSCPAPTVPENSIMTGNNFTYGSKVTFSCKKGFQPQVPYEFQCLSSLRWTGTPPTCHPVTCGGPPTVENADYTLNTNTYLSTVTYTCNEGYRPQGSMEVICEATGEWSRPFPRCVRVLCSEPPLLENAVTVGENFELGNKVHYVCKEGYTLIGPETRECLSTGQWSESTAQCVPRSCGPPPAIDHAEPYETHKLFGDTANYYCTDGYTAGNNSKMVCNAQGVWVPPDGMEAPRCIANFCLRPPELPHAILDSVNKPKYASNIEVSYKCEEGFMLNTTATLRCLMGGEWVPSPYDIGCVPVRCSKPESIDQGYVIGTNYSFGAVVAYSCFKGFLIRGEKRRTCKGNGEWGGALPTCVPVSCSQPPSLKNGYPQVKGRLTYNSKVTYACNAGYRLIGRPERVCQANRQWSNQDPPTCVLLTCDPPPNIVHGHYKGSDFQVGRKVVYVCDEGYELVGDATWTCLKFGRWDKTRPPRCSPVQCPEPPLEENHLVLRGLDSESGTVELSCEDGYVLEGARFLRCTPSQEWNDTFPVCKQVFCGPPPAVPFGGPSRSSHLFPFSSVVTYMCIDGFTLRKEGSVSCLANGQWSSPYPECIPVECPQPVEISDGIVDVQGLMYLSKALYSCKTGYNLVGNSTILCGEKGLWIGGVPSCRPIECSVPKQITNGKVVYTKLQFDHSATYSCNRGYRLQGTKTVRCLASGEWDIEPPACVQISCTPPQPVENGFVEGQDHSYGVTIFYSCFPGFQLVGQDHLTCEEFGWSSSVPVCVPSDCGLPPHIDFGEYVRVTELGGRFTSKDTGRLDLNFLHGTLIEYRCHHGYDLTSQVRLVCQEDGGWNGTAPSCVPAECQIPPSPDHGWMNVTHGSLGTTLTYTCDEGYELKGEPVRQCVSGRVWTTDAPVCQPVSCGDPGAVDNGTTQGGDFVYPEVLHFQCNPGFVLKGSSTIACQADGKWTGLKPQCEPVSCGPPKIPGDITFKGTEFTYNNKIELSCQPGFILNGRSPSICQADGTWSHKAAACVPARCEKPSPILNGRMLGSEFGYSSKIKYECDEGYTLNGDSTRVCQSDGLWDKPAPRCDIISCDPPEDISHGYVNGSSFNYDDIVEYVCFDGYEVVGDPILRCSAQGLWVGPVPQCQPCICTLPVVKFGVVLGHDRACGDRVHFQCDDGYKLLGPSQAVCEKGGVWSPGVPVCSRGRCTAAPPTVPNAVLQGGSASFPETAIYRCRPGYQLKGYAYLTCGRDGRWGEPRIRCEPVSCGKPPEVANARVVGDIFSFPNQITYRCDDGYELATQTASLSCQSDATWSKHNVRCRPTPCLLPTNFSIPHLVITGKELTPVGGTVTLSCPTGFYLQGSALAECQVGGSWSPSISSVSCEMVMCEKPPPLLHGIVEGDSYNYGDFVMYSCLPGFDMKGDSIHICQGDRTWSGTQPVCVASSLQSCGAPPAVQNAQPAGEPSPDNVTYVCNPGLQLIGPETLTCLDNGTWSLPVPTCEVVRGCISPKQMLHGKVQELSLNTGHALKFQCDNGYNLVGDPLVVCIGGNAWSSAFPTCQPKSCPAPPGWNSSGDRVQQEFRVGQSVRVTCPKGQQVKGSGTITCRSDRTWSPMSSVCERVSCGPPLHVANGVVRGAVFQFGDVAVYSCYGGYTMEGIGRSRCLENGTWTPPPTCRAVCWLQCQNGGVCQRPNTCSCPEGWMGRLCEEPICILPCLNGGRCVAPYQCECPTGWTGTRCHTAVCTSACQNGGRCIRPNRCSCPSGWIGHNCSRKRKPGPYHF